jgi:hypothetical protein
VRLAVLRLAWGGTFHDDFQPPAGDVVAHEHWGSSGFASTDLDLQLKQHGVRRIISRMPRRSARLISSRPRTRLRAARSALPRGGTCLACGRCGRKLELAWSKGQPAYRCRHGHTSATRPNSGKAKTRACARTRSFPTWPPSLSSSLVASANWAPGTAILPSRPDRRIPAVTGTVSYESTLLTVRTISWYSRTFPPGLGSGSARLVGEELPQDTAQDGLLSR